MRTDAQKETSRRNGARSLGPVTPRGKARSARNRYTHGLYSKTIVIEGEESARFHTLLQGLRADLQPATPLEEGFVEELAACRWRQRRLLAMETACLTAEIRGQQPDPLLDSAALRAVRALTRDSATLDLISRGEVRLSRQFDRTLRRFLALREAQQNAGKIKKEDSNPAKD